MPNPNAPEHIPMNRPAGRPQRTTRIIAAGKSRIFNRERRLGLNAMGNAFTNYRNHRVTAQGARQFNRANPGAPARAIPQVPVENYTNPGGTTNTGRSTPVTCEMIYVLSKCRRGTRIIEPYLEYVCHYANEWHTKLRGTNRHSFGTPPLFYFWFGESFLNDLRRLGINRMSQPLDNQITRGDFMNLRYFFIPITADQQNGNGRMALVAISPEAKTVDFLCSDGDDGQSANGPRGPGTMCLELIFQWLATYLGNNLFTPEEWRMRTNESARQPDDPPRTPRKNAAVYAATYAQCLAFGYPISDLKTKIWDLKERRFRVAQDLLNRGFDFHSPMGPATEFYIPLLDTAPTNGFLDGWRPLDLKVRNALYYMRCRSKRALGKHCRRNRDWYPGWGAESGAGRLLGDFKAWVCKQDDKRRRGVAPYVRPAIDGNAAWIPPDAPEACW